MRHFGTRKSGKKIGLRPGNKFTKIFVGVAPVFALAFVASFLASSIFAPVNMSNAADSVVSAAVTASAYSMTLTVTPNVTLSLSAAPSGAMTVGEATVQAETNSPNGYKIYLGMTGTNSITNDLVHASNDNYRLHSSGTFKVPVALTDNTWGYAMRKSDAASVDATNGFDDSYSTMESATPTLAKFAAVPTSASESQLISKTTVGNSGNPNTFNVYYGARANYTAASGSYTNKVLYTGIADASARHALYVSPEETPSIDGGDTLLITTTLYSTASTIEADAYILTAAERTAANNNTLDWATVATSKMSCSRTANNYLELTCTNVAKPIGDYYVYVNVPAYGEHYEKEFSYVANFYNIVYMQDMTADICNDVKYVTTPSNQVYNGSTFSDSTVHSYPRATYADTGTATYYPNHLGETDYVPETTLIDNRDSVFVENNEEATRKVSYTVRKLADGNCWMTENLALNFKEGHQFTSADTNVQATKTAAHATQALNGTPTGDEINENCSDNVSERICWYEGATAGAYSDRWLSRSTNGAKENTYSAVESQTGENQEIGTYYNWYTAVLGSKTANSYQEPPNNVATEDICPRGWELPTYTGDGSWLNLTRNVYGLTLTDGGQADNRANYTLHKFPFSVPHSGAVNRASGASHKQGTYNESWTAGANSEVAVRRFTFNNDKWFNPVGNAYKTEGQSVRCVAK